MLLSLLIASLPIAARATHVLGPLISVDVPEEIGPATGGSGPWEYDLIDSTYDNGQGIEDTKFLMLNFVNDMEPGDMVELLVGGVIKNTLQSSDGASLWTKPLEGGAVKIRYVKGASGNGKVTLTRYGRGELIDLFQKFGYVDPGNNNPAGICKPPATPSWINVDCLDPAQYKTQIETAQSVGMIIFASDDQVDPVTKMLTPVLVSCSGTVVDSATFLTSGHCISSDQSTRLLSAWITLDFMTKCDGSPPDSYDPYFYKVDDVFSGLSCVLPAPADGDRCEPWDRRKPLDYSFLQISEPFNADPVPVWDEYTPTLLDEVFIIHHPRGSAKKVSNQLSENDKILPPTCHVVEISDNNGGEILHGCDIDNGSSGSSSFDISGKIIALNNGGGNGCEPSDLNPLAYSGRSLLMRPIYEDVQRQSEQSDAPDANVMLTLDVSGSMSLDGESGESKIFEMKEAAKLFVALLKNGQGLGLVEFSDAANLLEGLDDVDDAHKEAVNMEIDDMTPGGATSIGSGLLESEGQLAAGRPPFQLLMTDGMQNVAPTVEEAEESLDQNTKVCVVGFGTEASLDGALLTGLAARTDGLYTRAESGIELKKFFSLCFGGIFNTGTLTDPVYYILDGEEKSENVTLQVCDETELTVVIGWNDPQNDLQIELIAPDDTTVITSDSDDVDYKFGMTWAYLRISLPYSGYQAGAWKARAKLDEPILIRLRRRLASLFSWPRSRKLQEGVDAVFFLSVLVDGGPVLRGPLGTGPSAPRLMYTGDRFVAVVQTSMPGGGYVPATGELEVTRPTAGSGEILTGMNLEEERTLEDDVLPKRFATLLKLEEDANGSGPLIPFVTETWDLEDGYNGVLEDDGILYLATEKYAEYEGTHTFRAVVEYNLGTCIGTRETTWSIYVVVGIDASQTVVMVEVVDPYDESSFNVKITFTPRDIYDRALGPGRASLFQVISIDGIIIDPEATVEDNDDGSYYVYAIWHPLVSDRPGVGIVQPERPKVQAATTDPPESTPPICTAAEPSVGSCWPPNHSFWQVFVIGVWTFDDVDATIEILSVEQTELGMEEIELAQKENELRELRADGKSNGDGNTDLDFIIADDKTSVELRCERSGKNNGRIYTVEFEATDSTGQTCQGSVDFFVFKSLGV